MEAGREGLQEEEVSTSDSQVGEEGKGLRPGRIVRTIWSKRVPMNKFECVLHYR